MSLQEILDELYSIKARLEKLKAEDNRRWSCNLLTGIIKSLEMSIAWTEMDIKGEENKNGYLK